MIVEAIHEGTYEGGYEYRPISLKAYRVRKSGDQAEIASFRRWALRKERLHEVDYLDGRFDVEWRDGACARCAGLGYAAPSWASNWQPEGGYWCFDCTKIGIKPGRGMVVINHIDDEIRAEEAYRRDVLGEQLVSTDVRETVDGLLRWRLFDTGSDSWEGRAEWLRRLYRDAVAAGHRFEADYVAAAGQLYTGMLDVE